jgi:hypothetical protein
VTRVAAVTAAHKLVLQVYRGGYAPMDRRAIETGLHRWVITVKRKADIQCR